MENSASLKYVHEESTHNIQSPGRIVPFIVEIFSPKSIIDVGCGIGTFLYEFKKHGVKEVLGLDGKWVNKNKLLIANDEFIETNLEQPIQMVKKYDFVLCLEVAEHISEKSADVLVNSLIGLGKVIAFSAAIKKQGGQNHINEQPFSYWKEKFEKKGYYVIDLFRPLFWNDEKIQWWYKQNMYLLVHNSIDKNILQIENKYFSENDLIIHPELYYERMKEYENKCLELKKIRTGLGGNLNFYFGLLFKKLVSKFRN